jgi:hypothetical protein
MLDITVRVKKGFYLIIRLIYLFSPHPDFLRTGLRAVADMKSLLSGFETEA